MGWHGEQKVGDEGLCDLLGMGSGREGRPQQVSNRAGGEAPRY